MQDNYIKLYKLKVVANELNNFNQERKLKVIRAMRLLEEVVNSEVFKEVFLKLNFPKYIGRQEVPPASQIWNRFVSGADEYGEADGDLDIHLTFYYRRWSRVVGYIIPGGQQYINGKYFDSYSIPEIAGNLAHEYMHRLGFEDDQGENSIPYAVGYAVERIANGMLAQKDLALINRSM